MFGDRSKGLEKIVPLGAAQFLGVFNDHAFKMLSVLTAIEAAGAYSSDTLFLSLITLVFVTPFIIFTEAAGYFADKFSKRNVLVITKFIELIGMLCGIYFLANVPSFGPYPLLAVLFLVASAGAFFSPPFNGIIPELFSEHDLSKVNGIFGMLSFTAIITGVGGGVFLKDYFKTDLYQCGIIFSLISIAGFYAALQVVPGYPSAPERKWSWLGLFGRYYGNLKFIYSRRNLFLAMLGESYFYVFGASIQSVLVLFVKYTLHVPAENATELGIIQLVPALGMGLGCYFAGIISRGKVELGLVPLGAAGMIIFTLLTAYAGNVSFLLHGIQVFPMIMIYLLLLGIFSGFFVVPLKSYQQYNTQDSERGRFFAASNMVCFSLIFLSGILMFFLGGGDEKSSGTGIMAEIQSHCLSLSPQHILSCLALLTLLFSIFLFRRMPEFVMRFLIVAATNFMYKVRIKGAEYIPEKGPGIIVANHVSFIDAIFISSCTSRNVRFMMHEDYFRYPLIYPFVKWAGFIEVPAINKPKRLSAMLEEIQARLRAGELICVFPEGKITRNGLMDEFKEGISNMIPDDINVPVIPVRLGMIWGSLFSYYYGGVKIRFPREYPYPASISIGKPVSKKTTPFKLRQLLSELAADTEKEARDREMPIHTQFAKNVRRHPFRKSIIDFGKKPINNFSVMVRSILLSREIRRLSGPADSKYIGVMLPNSCAAAVTLMSVLMADKVPAVINFTASLDSIKYSMEKAGIKIILTSKLFLQKANIQKLPEMIFLEDIAAGISSKKKFLYTILTLIMPYKELIKLISPASYNNVFNTAVLLFSSGSTGKPKGIMLSHHNLNSNIYSFLRIMGWTNKDKLTGSLPLFHCYGLNTCFWIPFMIGNEVVYIPNPLDSASIGEAIKKHKLSILLATPTFIQNYMRKCTAEQFKSLRLVITGAEKLRADIAEKFRKMTGLSLVEGYGCTELSPVVSINISNSILNMGIITGKQGSIGAPMPGICVKIVNPETFEELPQDTEGLMLVKAASVMQGYVNEPEKTAEVIKDGWYNTGDIAKMNADGYINITGRLSRFSKIAGEMVPHELVENAINEILKTEERCIAVTGVPDPSKGEKLVVFHTELQITPEKIIEELRTRQLPNLWIPKQDAFIKIEKLPFLGSGKIDMASLKKLAEDLVKNAKA